VLASFLISGYANWSVSTGWNARIHGLAYKTPPLNDSQLDDAAKIFLPGLNTSNLTTTERVESRNVTAEILSIPWPGELLNFTLIQPNGGDNCGNCGNVSFGLRNVTTDVGEFDEVIPLGRLEGVHDGTGTGAGFVTKLDLISSVDAMSEFSLCRNQGQNFDTLACRQQLQRATHQPTSFQKKDSQSSVTSMIYSGLPRSTFQKKVYKTLSRRIIHHG
jgi:hypothetical protein